jgi:hypothetical protein
MRRLVKTNSSTEYEAAHLLEFAHALYATLDTEAAHPLAPKRQVCAAQRGVTMNRDSAVGDDFSKSQYTSRARSNYRSPGLPS